MITYTTGDIFEAKTEAIVNTVNIEGVMGKGLALQFKKRFPENFKAYAKACKNGGLSMGKMFTHYEQHLAGGHYIINFPTKKSWRNKSRIEDIETGLQALVTEMQRLGITSLAIPPLGCGLGGLPWSLVKEAIQRAFENTDFEVIVYEPLQKKSPVTQLNTQQTRLTIGKALILELFRKYMNLVPTVSITFVEAHKLCYLLQCAGADLKLRFVPCRYGPYAQNLSHVFADMENRWIEGFGDGKRLAFETLALLPLAKHAATMLNEKHMQYIQALDDIFCGFETPVGLELIATTHWLITQDSIPPTEEHVRAAIAAWCDNKESWGDRKVNFLKDYPLKIIIERAQLLIQSVEDKSHE